MTRLRNKLFPQKTYGPSATPTRPGTPWTDNILGRSASPAPDLQPYSRQTPLSQFGESSGRASPTSRPGTPWTDNSSVRSASPAPDLAIYRHQVDLNQFDEFSGSASSSHAHMTSRRSQRLVGLRGSAVGDVTNVALNAEYAALTASGPLPWAQRGSEWAFGEAYWRTQTQPQLMHATPVGYFSGGTANTESAMLNADRNLPRAPQAGEWDPNGLYPLHPRAHSPVGTSRTPAAGYLSEAQPKGEYATHAQHAVSHSVHLSPQAQRVPHPSDPQPLTSGKPPTPHRVAPAPGAPDIAQPTAQRSTPINHPPQPRAPSNATAIGQSKAGASAFNTPPRTASPPGKALAIGRCGG